ncbi:MAG: ATP-binding protein [bacterium]
MLSRQLQGQIKKRLGKGKIIILLGARQVGKTTLVQSIDQQSDMSSLWLIGDEPDVRAMLQNTTSTQLKSLIGKKELLILDEAQRIENIGITLKLIADQIKHVQVIATGSSALELADRITEPLTGRKFEFLLYPFSVKELIDHFGMLEECRMLEHRMIYGMYPEVINQPGDEKEVLAELTNSYLYKDLLALEQVKKPVLLEKLLTALALQIGKQVSYRELGQLVGADNQTVERYINFLEKTFIIFRLQALSRNLRNEIKKSRKIYFLDTGIRNAIIKKFQPLAMREDTGVLWENFAIAERQKINHYSGRRVNQWFWRTHAQQEIDLIEEGEKMSAFEFKWNPRKKVSFPRSFLQAYPDSETSVITPKNYLDFLT